VKAILTKKNLLEGIRTALPVLGHSLLSGEEAAISAADHQAASPTSQKLIITLVCHRFMSQSRACFRTGALPQDGSLIRLSSPLFDIDSEGPARQRKAAPLTCLEICAGAGGQALGLDRAGFRHVGLIEVDHDACNTLRLNRPDWPVIESPLQDVCGKDFEGVDLLAGGVPCPPFSKAGRQLGAGDERDLFPEALRLVREVRPRAVLLENVRGLLDSRFEAYRQEICNVLRDLGFVSQWRLLNACDFGVAQLRPRAVLVALKPEVAAWFRWPCPSGKTPPTVGEVLARKMAEGGWEGAAEWARKANRIAPTIVGGSQKHGGPDLGPTRARREWETLGVDGSGIADAPPPPGFQGLPRLTVSMVALLQGFPEEWVFFGKKTAACRQIGNAFPPPVAMAIGQALHAALACHTLEARR
jgi:DNA (cytosine-5)-methyltransferase 1